MNKWTWKEWTAFGICAAVVIAAVVCHFVQPEVSYALLESVACGTFVLGGIAGYLLKKNDIIKTEKKEEETKE